MNKFNKSTLTMLLCLMVSLAAASWGSRSLAADVAVIRIKYRWASEVLPIVQSMLSPEGTVTVSKRINSLIIVDRPDAIQRVRNYLDMFDKPIEQVKIHVRFQENRAAAGKNEKETAIKIKTVSPGVKVQSPSALQSRQ